VGRGIFVLDRTDPANERFSLYHHREGFSFGGTSVGPGEQWLDLTLDDLEAGEVVEVTLIGSPDCKSKAVDDLATEWIAVGRPSDLPSSFTETLPDGSPLWSRLFWIAPARSALITALKVEIQEPPLRGVSAALRLCDRLDEAIENLPRDRRTGAPEEMLEAGFHQAEGDTVEAWLRATGCQIVGLSELLQEIVQDRSGVSGRRNGMR